MSAVSQQLVILPVVLPLAAGGLMLLLDERRHRLKGGISLAAALCLLFLAAVLTVHAGESPAFVYRLGDWPAPFGIVLVADRLSALMVLLAAMLGAAALLFSLARWHRGGPHFHSLVQFLLAGLNGTFLTGVRVKKTAGADIQAGISIDQVAADSIGGLTRFPSLELSCDAVRKSGS